MTETISDDIRNEFTKLYNQWQLWLMQPGLRISSKTQDYIECQPYRDIVKLGEPAVPLIIKKLEEGRATGWNNAQFFLWYAVRDITAIDLSKKKPYATEQEIAELYIDWWATTHQSQ